MKSMMNVAISSLLLLLGCFVHHCDCLPAKENYDDIAAELAGLLHRVTKTDVDEQPRKKVVGTAGHFSLTSDKRTADDSLANCGQPRIAPSISVSRLESRIVGGSEARKHSWPWQCRVVSDFRPDYVWVGGCGGSVISDKYILTAAHCFVKRPKETSYWARPSKIEVACGLHKNNRRDWGSDPAVQLRNVSRVVIHENYSNISGSRGFDVAVIALSKPLIFNDYVQPVCLPSSPVAAGTNCVATGWGQTRNTGNKIFLRQVMMKTISLTDCRAKLRFWLKPNQMCARTEGGKGVCSGDSGGPLVCKQGDKWFQYGISSFTRGGCASARFPDGFANVVNLLPWIQEHTGIGAAALMD